jgi:hypothetical protein
LWLLVVVRVLVEQLIRRLGLVEVEEQAGIVLVQGSQLLLVQVTQLLLAVAVRGQMAAVVDLPVLTLFSLPSLLLVVAAALQTQETAAVERVELVLAHHQMRLGLETHPAFPPPKATTAGWDKIAT